MKKLRYLKYLIGVILVLSISASIAQDQDYVIIQKQNSNRQHKLELPQRMGFHFNDIGIKRYDIKGYAETGFLFTDDGVAIMGYQKLHAKRFKPEIWKFSGGMIAALGAATTITGILLSTGNQSSGSGFDFIGSGPEYLLLTVVGIPILYSGIMLAKSKKTYNMEKWEMRLTPSEFVKQPVGEMLLTPRD